ISNKKSAENSIAGKILNKDKSGADKSDKKTYNAIAQTQKENQNSSVTENNSSIRKKEDMALVQNQNETVQKNEKASSLIKQTEKSAEETGIAQAEEEKNTEESGKKSLIEYLKEKEAEEEILANTDNSLDERWAISPNF